MIGLALLRALVGLLLVGHGAQKVLGKFGGAGPEGTGQFFEMAGLRPGKRNALLAGGSEMGGGALLALGWATPLACAALSGVMITAIRAVHAPKGPWVTDGGWEYNAVLLAGLFAVTDVGPGPISVDHLLGNERKGPLWAIAELAAGAAGSEAVFRLAKGQPEQGGGPVEAATGGA
jgi:putative oxidoreductase